MDRAEAQRIVIAMFGVGGFIAEKGHAAAYLSTLSVKMAIDLTPPARLRSMASIATA